MCGICGEWNPGGVAADGLRQMGDLLRHRGPDGEGLVVLGEMGLAMHRLSVIDLPGGRQPLHNETGDAWIVFNGEIYNHRELRRDLIRRGHSFSTWSDTEVILHLYEERGEEVAGELRGMFAFAIWDARRRRLLLARDRFGQKPLFYRWDGTRFLFASETKALLSVLGTVPDMDLLALDEYLALRCIPSDRTMFEGIRKLAPAHLLVLEAPAGTTASGSSPAQARLTVRRYWQLRFLPKRRLGEAEAAAELDERLNETVSCHLGSDVPLGAFLSGGIDSSLVVALAARAAGEPLPTFSIGVSDQGFDELPFARRVAEHCGTRHHEERVQPDMVRMLPRMVERLDEPSDPMAPCMFHAAALAARHVKVVLGGEGGDEVFAGYDRYSGLRWARLYAALPAPLRRHLLGPAIGALDARPASSAARSWAQRTQWLHALSFATGGRRYAEATSFFRFGRDDKAGLYAPEVAARLAGTDPLAVLIEAYDAAVAGDDLDRMLHADLATRLPEHSLLLADRMTMAHGIEGRSPLLDHHLAEFAATLPPALKLRGGRLKYLLRRVARRYLPESILRRPKQGFTLPLGDWMRGPLVPVLSGLLCGSAVLDRGLFRADGIERLLAEHLEGRCDHQARLWMILNVEVWCRLFLGGESLEDVEGRLCEPLARAA